MARVNKLSGKIGHGKYAIVTCTQIKRIAVPLPSNHLLFVSLEGEEFDNI